MPGFQPLDLVGNYFAGRQAVDQERAADTRNALGRQELDYRKQQMSQQQQTFSDEQKRQFATQMVQAAQYGIQSQSPKAFIEQNYPQLAQLAGPQWAQLDDEAVRGKLQEAIGHFGPVAGIGPAQPKAPEEYTLKPGETRFRGDQQIASIPGGPDDGGFTLSPGQIRYGPDGKPIASAPNKETPEQTFDRAAKLRGEFNMQSKEFRGVADSYQRILDSASDPSAAGDLALIFNYMKILDPGSTVREGEFATAQNAGGVDSRVVSLYNRLMNGERLSPGQRTDFVSRATKLYKGQETRFQNNTIKRYEYMSRKYGIDPRDVIVDMNAHAPASGQVGQGPVRVNSPQEAMSLPSGTVFITPDGRQKVRP